MALMNVVSTFARSTHAASQLFTLTHSVDSVFCFGNGSQSGTGR